MSSPIGTPIDAWPDSAGVRMLKPRYRRSKDPKSIEGKQNEPIGYWHEQMGGTVKDPVKGGNPSRTAQLGLPSIPHADALASLLGISTRALEGWIGGLLNEQNYVVRGIAKKSGGTRYLMAPMPKLKALQRTLRTSLVDKLPLNACVHGFRRDHDILSNGTVHVNKRVVICMDVLQFFPSFDLRRVCGYFRWLGYSRGIALSLAKFTTADSFNGQLVSASGREGFAQSTPAYVALKNQYRQPQLPQGAPTSPGIANAIVWRMDKRLTALARKFGGDYTRYADDLTFSGFEKMAKHAKLIVALVEKIVHTEGLAINKKKTRIMRKGRQQRVTGVVVNKQTNASREQFDLLKAILHNCAKKGPSTQNRSNHPNFKEHLRGRVAHIAHIGPERGAKLKKLFDAIDWSR